MHLKTFYIFKVTLIIAIFFIIIGISFYINETRFMYGHYYYENILNFVLKILYLGAIIGSYIEYNEIKKIKNGNL